MFVGLVCKHTGASCVNARIWQSVACDQARVRVYWGGALCGCAGTFHVDGGISGQQMGRSTCVCECGKPACKEAVATADSLRPHGMGVSYRDCEERICSGEAHMQALAGISEIKNEHVHR